ncbi:MAG: hypothetical protein MUO63_21150, partial [Desulfobulbaceae bacterium]|nr:hypothetical protein [Desulfobulbaceae bacterium]
LVENIKKRLATELGIGVDVKLVEEKPLERFEGKAKRVIDKRKLLNKKNPPAEMGFFYFISKKMHS